MPDLTSALLRFIFALEMIASLPGMTRTKTYLVLIIIVVLGAALRLDFLLAGNFGIDSDEAIVGLMAKHIVEGREPPIFYYGQHYMGSLEPMLVALGFMLFGVSAAVLKLVPFLFSLVLIVLVYRLARLLSSESAALMAALFIAVPASPLVLWSGMARGGFIEIICIGVLSFIFLVEWLQSQKLSFVGIIPCGLAIGVGWWVNSQILYFALPMFFVVCARVVAEPVLDWRQKSKAAMMLMTVLGIAFFAGGLPFWIYNFQHDFASFAMFKSASVGLVGAHFVGVFSAALPILLGARRFWSAADLYPGATLLVCYFYLLIALLFLRQRFPQVRALFCLRLDRDRPVEVLAIFFVLAIGLFSVSHFGFLFEAPRYLLPLYPAFAILSSVVISGVAMRSRARAGALAIVLLGINVCSCYFGGRALQNQPLIFGHERVSKDHGELLEWLARNNYEFVRANYWIGYRLAFESRETVRFMLSRAPFEVRIPEYETEGAEIPAGRVPLVLTQGQGKLVHQALIKLGYHFKEKDISGYRVMYELAPKEVGLKAIAPKALRVAASTKSDDARLAIDGDRTTRWGSGVHQKPGLAFQVSLDNPRKIRGISLDCGKWIHDFPRAMRINYEDDRGIEHSLIDKETARTARYFEEDSPVVTVSFAPQVIRKVTLLQDGSDKIFDWSIAELSLLE